MIRAALLVASAVTLVGCATTPPEPEVKVVYVDRPVAVSCVPTTLNIDPEFQVSRGDVVGAADAAERLRLTGAGFLERDAYLSVIQPVLKGCAHDPQRKY